MDPVYSGTVKVGAFVTIKCEQGNLYSKCESDGTWSHNSCPELGNEFRRDNRAFLVSLGYINILGI